MARKLIMLDSHAPPREARCDNCAHSFVFPHLFTGPGANETRFCRTLTAPFRNAIAVRDDFGCASFEALK